MKWRLTCFRCGRRADFVSTIEARKTLLSAAHALLDKNTDLVSVKDHGACDRRQPCLGSFQSLFAGAFVRSCIAPEAQSTA